MTLSLLGCDPVHRLHGTVFAAPPAGVVTDQYSTPLSNVEVTILQRQRILWIRQAPRQRQKITTGPDGRYDVTMVTGNYTVKHYILRFTKAGYSTVELDLGEDLRHHTNVRISRCYEVYAACQGTDVVMSRSRAQEQ